jgi:hypothetical protein
MKILFYVLDKVFGNGKPKRRIKKDCELCDD